jgi:hypothetical protein
MREILQLFGLARAASQFLQTFIGFDGVTDFLELSDLLLLELWCHLPSDGDIMFQQSTMRINLSERLSDGCLGIL